MSQRRMPSGQGPARSSARPGVASGPRATSQRGRIRRTPDRPARPETADRGGIRRAAGPARRTRAPRRPRRISGRAAVLGALLIALAFAYAYPVRVYLEQQAQINALNASQQQQRQRIQNLTDSLAKWNDDDYVIAQARTRFQLVRKGELLYVVMEPTDAQSGTKDQKAPWFESLWSNLQEIDDPPTR